ncbi:unnamed protein product [Rotaria sp. Silwood2]|nr:unnamed protein product [Rotaria sp. Silwood2]CAF2528138.1 unnamed protein product [Rotaria sp. Silwood2]CAF2760394.1 unnamed protein product [Rotaria sp. Silwood2]CAF2938226.1 unnamed protein product [Rotaria sp. Silwood2]CAF3853456.1 unnamed protein product [Rotaria sp. Silwood2]
MQIFILFLCVIPCCFAEIWNIYIYTGNERFAGTDSNIYIRLFNSKDESTGEYQLTHSNWIPDTNDFPLRNLFEMGAVERFRIRTEDIGSVAKIHIRHNNFPFLQADWLLDQVIVERFRDGTKYTFKCNCWLRRGRPYVTLSALPDPHSIDKNKTDDLSSTKSRTLVIILVILITLVTGILCGFNEYRRRQRDPSLFFNDPIEQIHQEPSLLDTYYSQSPRPRSPSSESQFWVNTIRRWKNFRQGLPSYNHAQTTQSTAAHAAAPSIISPDEPPAYEDLYPNSTAPINGTSNLNS